MYASYEYYQTEYGGSLDEITFNRNIRIADKILDKLTHHRLINSFPIEPSAVEDIYQCECALVDYEAMVSMANDKQAKGEVVKSMSSGSESVTYDTTIYEEASRSDIAHMQGALKICKTWLGGTPDINGINLLYAGL